MEIRIIEVLLYINYQSYIKLVAKPQWSDAHSITQASSHGKGAIDQESNLKSPPLSPNLLAIGYGICAGETQLLHHS